MTCQTCGSEKQENYCPHCGEKKFDPHSLSIKHVIEEGIEGFTHADHTIFRTLKTLFFRPGQLSLDYIEGRRIKFMKPLGLFLVMNLIFFLFTNNALSQPLGTFLNYSGYLLFGTQQAVDSVLIRTGQSLAEFTKEFNALMRTSSKAYVTLLVLLYTLIFKSLMVKRSRTVIAHLIFALHFVSFMLALFMIQMIIAIPFTWLFGYEAWGRIGDDASSFTVMVLLGVYLSFAFKKFYNIKKNWSIVAALICTILFTLIIMAYRLFLFYKIVLLAH